MVHQAGDRFFIKGCIICNNLAFPEDTPEIIPSTLLNHHKGPPPMSARSRAWQLLEATDSNDTVAKWVNYFLLGLVFLNVVAVVLGTVESLQSRYRACFDYFELFSIMIFSTEYIGRMWSCVEDPRFAHPVTGRIRYAFHFMSLMDLAAILPFFTPFIATDTRATRIFRLLRLVRIVKIGRYYKTLTLFAAVVREKREELILTTVLMFMLLILSACLMYYCENEVQPDKFSSVPQSMWWSIETLTTVGYGDIYPVTTLGKIFSGMISILGLGMFALPAGILGAGFVEEIQKRKKIAKYCPHCGKEIQ